MNSEKALVGIVMGSKSDLPLMQAAAVQLEKFCIPFEITILSAHRTPERMVEYAETARNRGLKVIIAGAGGAAHLPGMIASLTTLPVIGVPVATVALNGAVNAGILAAQIVSISDDAITEKLLQHKSEMSNQVIDSLSSVDELSFKYRLPSAF
jgi:5-(carboxyamino)imidazole ribonucleotide mutase